MDALIIALGEFSDCVPDAIFNYKNIKILRSAEVNKVRCNFEFLGTKVSSLSPNRAYAKLNSGETLVKCQECDVSVQKIKATGVFFLHFNANNKIFQFDFLFEFVTP